MSRYICFLLCALVSATAFTQNGLSQMQLSGHVMDAQSGESLEYATVAIFDSKNDSLLNGGITTADGTFSIKTPPGEVKLTVEFMGYQSYSTNITMGNENKDIGTISLEPDEKLLDAVDIQGEKSQLQLRLDKRVFNVGKDLTNKGSNAADILDNIPSVEVDVEGNVSLRGSQNVRILIDGKPSGLTGLGDGEGLRLLQGNLIESVEIITNPSAKYDAEGEAGIINIILKKDGGKGLNGAVEASTGYPHNHGLGANLSYRKGNVNLFGSYSLNYKKHNGSGYYYQEIYNADSTLISEMNRKHQRGGLGNTGRLGMDFFIKEKNIITVSGMYRNVFGDNKADLVYHDFDNEGNIIFITDRNETEDEDKQNIEVDLRFKKEFKKKDQKWTVDAKWHDSNDRESSTITEAIRENDTSDIFQRVENVEDEINWLAQTDYVHPFGKTGKIETGAKFTDRTIENNYAVDEQQNSEWVPVEGFNDVFTYEERIYAGYLILGMKHGAFSWQAGLRSEFSDIATHSEANDTTNRRDYLDWFPSVHLSYELSKGNTLQASYSRRLSRPEFWWLLPFFTFSDSRTFPSGNPNLDPEYTNAIEASYLKVWGKGSLLSSIYFRHITGVIERITQVEDDGTAFMFPINLSTEKSAGLELSFNYTPWKWWSLTTGLNVAWSKRDGEYEGEILGNETIVSDVSLSSKWKLPQSMDLQISYKYQAPNQTTQGRRLSSNSVDAGFSKDFLKGDATITFSGKDIFNTRKRRIELDNDDYYRLNEFQWRGRQLVLTFSYRINAKKSRTGIIEGDNRDL